MVMTTRPTAPDITSFRLSTAHVSTGMYSRCRNATILVSASSMCDGRISALSAGVTVKVASRPPASA